MNKFSKRLAFALMACAAAGAAACQEQNKPEDKPAASTPAPAPVSEAAPAPEAKTEAAATPAAEPAKPAETAAATPAPTPAPAPEPEKKAEAPAAPAPAPATEAAAAPAEPAASATAPATEAATAPAQPAAQPEQVAQAEPAATPSAAPAAAPAAPAASSEAPNPDDPNAPPLGSRKPDGSAVYPNPVADLAKTMPGVKFEDGRYRNKDGEPVPVVTKDYMVDWGTWNGFRRYHDACHVCHGPNALGSTFAPALAESLKTMDYNTFIATVSSGRQVNRAGTEYVMPSFGEDKNIMCYIDDIYTYIKARSENATDGKTGMPPGRPNGREDISPEAKKAADECTG